MCLILFCILAILTASTLRVFTTISTQLSLGIGALVAAFLILFTQQVATHSEFSAAVIALVLSFGCTVMKFIKSSSWLWRGTFAVLLLCLLSSTYLLYRAYADYYEYQWNILHKPMTANSHEHYEFTITPDLKNKYEFQIIYNKDFLSSNLSKGPSPDPSLKVQWQVVQDGSIKASFTGGILAPTASCWGSISGGRTSFCLGPEFELLAGIPAQLTIDVISASRSPELIGSLQVLVPAGIHKDAYVVAELSLDLGVLLIIAATIVTTFPFRQVSNEGKLKAINHAA